MKVVINKCHGGFGLSYVATMAYAKRKDLNLLAFIYNRDSKSGKVTYTSYDPTSDHDPFLIFYSTVDLSNQDGSSSSSKGHFSDGHIARNDSDLVAVVEELGDAVNGRYAKLAIVEVPDDVKWEIEEYDGMEWVAEQHRTWH